MTTNETAAELLLRSLHAVGVRGTDALEITELVLSLHTREMSDKILDVENWPGAEHLSPGTKNTYRTIAGRASRMLIGGTR